MIFLVLVTLSLPTWVFAQNQFLMTVAGYEESLGPESPPWYKKVALVSLDPDVAVPHCLQELNDFQYLQNGCMANLLGDQPHICGGWYGDYIDKCYRYDPTQDMWTETGSFLTSRTGPRGYYGCTFSYSHGIVAAGGYGCIDECSLGPPEPLGNVDFTMDGQSFGQLTELPEGIQFNCLVALWGGELLSVGGSSKEYGSSFALVSEKAFIYSNSKREWTQVADMITPRERLMCGVVTAGDGSQQEVVAAGGRDNLGEASDVVEIYSVRDGDWRIASSLPSPIMGAAAVQLDTTFLLVGGGTNEWYGSDLIYRYDTTDNSWELLEARLPGAVTGVAATMVNSYIFPSCE